MKRIGIAASVIVVVCNNFADSRIVVVVVVVNKIAASVVMVVVMVVTMNMAILYLFGVHHEYVK